MQSIGYVRELRDLLSLILNSAVSERAMSVIINTLNIRVCLKCTCVCGAAHEHAGHVCLPWRLRRPPLPTFCNCHRPRVWALDEGVNVPKIHCTRKSQGTCYFMWDHMKLRGVTVNPSRRGYLSVLRSRLSSGIVTSYVRVTHTQINYICIVSINQWANKNIRIKNYKFIFELLQLDVIY